MRDLCKEGSWSFSDDTSYTENFNISRKKDSLDMHPYKDRVTLLPVPFPQQSIYRS